MRRATMILVLLASAGASLTTAGLASAGASPSAASALANAPSKSQAQAFARAVNLRATDVPGFKVSAEHGHEHETAAEKQLERELLGCIGAGGGAGHSSQLAEVSSKEFEREDKNGAQSVQSGVTVEPTAALAVKELAEVRSERGRDCFSHYLSLLFKGKKFSGASIGPVSISSGSPSAPGTSGSFGWRISTTITVHRVAVPFYMDILGFVYGPTEVSLLSFGLPEPFPAATEQHLFSLLLQRAKANSI